MPRRGGADRFAHRRRECGSHQGARAPGRRRPGADRLRRAGAQSPGRNARSSSDRPGVGAGRDAAKATAFAEEHGIERAASVGEAIAASDIVCTVTAATSPLVLPSMLHPGLHINAVGGSIPSMIEIDPGCLSGLSLFIDYRPSLEAEAAEVIGARARGLIGDDHPITEIGALLGGGAPGGGMPPR